jgi:hypothetical protein
MASHEHDRLVYDLETEALVLEEKNYHTAASAVRRALAALAHKRQSGMESKHEHWVMMTLNFLKDLDIPFYNRAPNGDRIKGDKDIPERLMLAIEKFKELERSCKEARTAMYKANDRVAEYKQHLLAMRAVAQAAAPGDGSVATILAIADTVPELRVQQPKGPDDRGVRRVEIDAREVVLRLGMQTVRHDLAPDEEICPQCLGLGLLKCDSSYGIGEQKPREDAFPYHYQWIAPCHICYMGKVKICGHCKKVVERAQVECHCEVARYQRGREQWTAEIERRKGLPRIPLVEYAGEMLWASEAKRYIMSESAEDFLEANADEVFFACKPISSSVLPEASDIMERMEEQAYDAANPEPDGDPVLEFASGAAEELDALLLQWTDKNVTARTLWYEDRNLIVEVPVPGISETDAANPDA